MRDEREPLTASREYRDELRQLEHNECAVRDLSKRRDAVIREHYRVIADLDKQIDLHYTRVNQAHRRLDQIRQAAK